MSPRVGGYKERAYMSSFAGYSGWYKDNFLRSGLEYVFAYLLDLQGVSYAYEPAVYYLSTGEAYKPDFLLNDGSFVEVKGTYNYEASLEKVSRFVEEYGYAVRFVFADDLHRMCIENGVSFNSLFSYWKTVATRDGRILFGSKNPRYGTTCSDSTKQKIREKAIERMNTPESRALRSEVAKKTNKAYLRKGIPTVEQVEWACGVCGKTEMRSPHKTDTKTCSPECFSRLTSMRFMGKEAAHRQPILKEARNIVILFVKNNPGIVADCPYNKISTVLSPMLDILSKETGIVDWRTISKAVLGRYYGRKELLDYLKSLI